jgi:hypothetical protein
MADTIFWQYPNQEADFGPSGWIVDPLASIVDDPVNAPDDGDRTESAPIGSALAWQAMWGVTPPASAVVITGLRLYARIWAHSENSTPHDLTDVKGCTNVGGTIYYTAGQTILGTTGASGMNPATYLLGSFATNPGTGLAWTLPELQAGVFGVEYTDQDVGSNTPRTYISQFYVEVDAQTIAQSIEGRRAEGSHYLLTLGRLHGTFEVMGPPGLVDLEPGAVVDVVDRLGPTAAGTGWGRKAWQRREALVLEAEWLPMVRRCRLLLFDLRFFRISLWWQPKTDLPYTEEGQGIPYLDSGGGYTIERSSVAYVRKQATDQLYAAVPIDFPKWTADGLQIGGGGDVTETLNNSFSQGLGGGSPTFTSWTQGTTASGSFAEDLADYVFDAAGLRRSAIVATGATVGSTVYLEQAHTITGIEWGRVAILFKHQGGAQVPHWQLQRAADAFYWDDDAEAWAATPTDNELSLAKSGRLDGEYSNVITFAAGADTYTLRVGYVTAGAVAPNQSHLYFAALIHGTKAQVNGFRSLDVTTTTAVSRTRDDLQIANAAPVRWWEPSRGGQIELRILSLFEHAAMGDGDTKPLLFCQGAGADYDAVLYLRTSPTEGRWRFHRRVGGVDYLADVVVASGFPELFQEHKLAARWTGPEEELNLGEGALSMLADGTWSEVTAAELLYLGETSTVFVGWNPLTSVVGEFVLQSLRARKLCLTDDETLRELG